MSLSSTKPIEIPTPPTGNHMYDQKVIPVGRDRLAARNAAGSRRGPSHMVIKFPTKEYREWLDAISPILRVRYGTINQPVIVRVEIFGGNGFFESRDWDNLLKCLGDSFGLREFQDTEARGRPKRPYGSGILSTDSVQLVRGWQTRYYTRDEHLQLLGQERPKNKALLNHRCMLQIVACTAPDFALR